MHKSIKPKLLVVFALFLILAGSRINNNQLFAKELSNTTFESFDLNSDSLYQQMEDTKESSSTKVSDKQEAIKAKKKLKEKSEEEVSPLSYNFFLNLLSKLKLSEYFDISFDFDFSF
ncbi:hypothetical protein OO013_11910 [Mangrovivirga sp. M17]|uniref:Uncharacterized protein n=1 Tax=Mangrovivirga halotolerans TaxID=2993936 RepID=A0ABT3RTK7_9BACT|nr:hypothetical protein [Mangrovivirga halotolerans]MCX2744577.1 hypothetical protein [Mangrovivirga halotolerans]